MRWPPYRRKGSFRLSEKTRKLLKDAPILLGVAVLMINAMLFVTVDPTAVYLDGIILFLVTWTYLTWGRE